MEKIKFFFINGRGSSGKDTQANLITKDDPRAARVSTGDIFRGASTPDGEYGRFYNHVAQYVDYVNAGGFLPDEVILPIVADVIKELVGGGINKFIFTGFPRTLGQLTKVRQWLSELKKETAIEANFICLAVSEERSVRLARVRRQEAIDSGKPVRVDDNEETLAKRLIQYRDKVELMLKNLIDDPEYPLIIIRGNRTIDEVNRDLRLKTERES